MIQIATVEHLHFLGPKTEVKVGEIFTLRPPFFYSRSLSGSAALPPRKVSESP